MSGVPESQQTCQLIDVTSRQGGALRNILGLSLGLSPHSNTYRGRVVWSGRAMPRCLGPI